MRHDGGSASGGGGGVRIALRTTQRGREARDVDAVGDGQAGARDEQAGERRARERRHVVEAELQRRGGLELVALHQPRDERVERRAAHRGEGGQQRRADVEHPQLRIGQRRVDEQRAGHDGGADLGDLDEPPAIEGVGQRAADEREHDDRRELGDPEQADGQRRAGQLVGLEGDRDEGRHRAQLGDRLAEDEQAEVAPPAQEAEVDGDRSDRPPPRRRGLGGVRHRSGQRPPGYVVAWAAHLGWRDGRASSSSAADARTPRCAPRMRPSSPPAPAAPSSRSHSRTPSAGRARCGWPAPTEVRCLLEPPSAGDLDGAAGVVRRRRRRRRATSRRWPAGARPAELPFAGFSVGRGGGGGARDRRRLAAGRPRRLRRGGRRGPRRARRPRRARARALRRRRPRHAMGHAHAPRARRRRRAGRRGLGRSTRAPCWWSTAASVRVEGLGSAYRVAPRDGAVVVSVQP